MEPHLSKLEATVEKLVEGTFERLFAGTLQPRKVARHLARAMEDAAQKGRGGARLAPTTYVVQLNPETLDELRERQPDLDSRLAGQLIIFARELGLVLARTPQIMLEPEPSLAATDLNITTPPETGSIEETRGTARAAQVKPADDSEEQIAYLILDGTRHVPLDKSVVSLGRQLDNTIILDDAHVSRHHAQLRQRYNRWVIYDLGSSGGTFVNGERIEECVLKPGDVIALAGIKLIYGEESGEGTGKLIPGKSGRTRPLPKRRLPGVSTGMLKPDDE